MKLSSEPQPESSPRSAAPASPEVALAPLQTEGFVCGPVQTNTYLLIDTAAQRFVVIDPSVQSDAALGRALELQSAGSKLEAIWNTHSHFDHVYDNARWKTGFGAEIWAHDGDAFFLENLREQSLWFGLPAPEVARIDHELHEGDRLQVGGFSCQVLRLPGHSPGSVGFYFEAQNLLVGGDVLFAGSVGRTDLPGSKQADLAASLRRLFALPPQTRVLTGHGEPTTIEIEARHNAVARALISQF